MTLDDGIVGYSFQLELLDAELTKPMYAKRLIKVASYLQSPTEGMLYNSHKHTTIKVSNNSLAYICTFR